MATLMEDMDSDSRSQNGLQGVDLQNPAHRKKGLGEPGEARDPRESAYSSRCLYHKQIASTVLYNNSSC